MEKKGSEKPVCGKKKEEKKYNPPPLQKKKGVDHWLLISLTKTLSNCTKNLTLFSLKEQNKKSETHY